MPVQHKRVEQAFRRIMDKFNMIRLVADYNRRTAVGSDVLVPVIMRMVVRMGR